MVGTFSAKIPQESGVSVNRIFAIDFMNLCLKIKI